MLGFSLKTGLEEISATEVHQQSEVEKNVKPEKVYFLSTLPKFVFMVNLIKECRILGTRRITDLISWTYFNFLLGESLKRL